MENTVLKRTLGLNGDGEELAEVELLLEGDDIKKSRNNQQKQNTKSKFMLCQKIHCIVESDSSSDELESNYFGITPEEIETVSSPYNDSSDDDRSIGKEIKNKDQLKQNKPFSNLTVREPPKRIVIDDDIELVESEREIVTLLSDDDCNMETSDNDESVSNEAFSMLNPNNKEVDAKGNRVREHPRERDTDDDIQLVDNENIIVDLISDESVDSENETIDLISDESDSDNNGPALKRRKIIKKKKNCNITLSPGSVPFKIKKSDCCVIDELVEQYWLVGVNPIAGPSGMSDERKCEIIRQGRPFPKEDSVFPRYTTPTPILNKRDYLIFPWLTACLEMKQLLCWPCLLVYCRCDLCFVGSKNSLKKGHERQSVHRHAEVVLGSWLNDIAQNKTPIFHIKGYQKVSRSDPPVINQKTGDDNHLSPVIRKVHFTEPRLRRINYSFLSKENPSSNSPGQNNDKERQVQQNIASTAKSNLINNDSEGKRVHETKQKTTVSKPTTAEPSIRNLESGGKKVRQKTQQKATVSQPTTAKPSVMNHKSGGGKTKQQKTTVGKPYNNLAISYPNMNFLGTEEAASIHLFKTGIRTDICKTPKRIINTDRPITPTSTVAVRDGNRVNHKTASENPDTIRTDPDIVHSSIQPLSPRSNSLSLCINICNESLDEETWDFDITKLPIPDLMSLRGEPLPHSSSDLSHNLELKHHHTKQFMSPPNPHVFCSMGVGGIQKSYTKKDGVVIPVVVTDIHGKCADFKESEQKSLEGTKNDHVNDKLSESAPHIDCIVESLLVNSFSSDSWTHEQRVEMVRNGGPRLEASHHFDQHVTMDNAMIHKERHWLVETKLNGVLVCWPCLLFGSPHWVLRSTNSWTIIRRITSHRQSPSHRSSCFKYKAWVHEYVEIEPKTNLKVSNELLKCLIDVVCSMQMRTINTPSSVGAILKLLHSVTLQDTTLRSELNEISKVGSKVGSVCKTIPGAKAIEAVVSYFTERITESIFFCMHKTIIRELKNANFVCLILSRMRNQPWVSVVVRYMQRDGAIVERFIKGIGTESYIPCEVLIHYVTDIMDTLGCAKKLVGYTLDGAVIASSEMSLFDDMITTEYLMAKLFHYRAHDLRMTLLERLSGLTDVKVFCHKIYKLAKFIDHDKDVMMLLIHTMMSVKTGLDDGLPWDSSSDLIVTVKNHYPAFVLLFKKILSQPFDWTSETLVEASQFLEFLNDFHNRFYLATLSRILTNVECLAKSLNKGFNIVGLTKEANETITSLKNAKSGFSSIVEFIKNTWVPHSILQVPDPNEECYSNLYKELLKSAFDFVATTAGIIGRWYHSECQLYDLIQVSSSEELCLYRYDRLAKHTNFAFELSFLTAQIGWVQQSDFLEPLKNDPVRMARFLNDFDLVKNLSEYYRFLELILTVPLTTTATSLKTHAVDRAAAYVTTNGSLDTAAWICINSDLLRAMKQKDDFHAQVLSKIILKKSEPVQ